MWSFATHAGAGMAIAGLTATYYALARMNYQGERERMAHESGFGDGPQVNRLRKHNEIGQLSSSQMILKKELEELSVLNGSGSGLNIIYQQDPLHQFRKSNFEITPIVSRVDIRPSAIYAPSEEEMGTANTTGGGESVFGSRPILDKSNVSVERNTVESHGPSEPVIGKEEKVTVSKNEKGDGDVLDPEDRNGQSIKDNSVLNVDSGENEVESVSTDDTNKSESVANKCNSFQENKFLRKTPSPICFFMNPGFGNRYAVNVKKNELGPLVASLSSSKTHVVATASKVNGQVPKNNKIEKPAPSRHRKNSTEFILPPDLSKSNVSVCEAENPEKLLKRRKRPVPTDGNSIVDTFPLKETSEYNKTLRRKMNTTGKKLAQGKQPLIRLRADPEISNLCPPPKKRLAKPVLLEGSSIQDCNKNDIEAPVKDEEKKEESFNKPNENVFEEEKAKENNNNIDSPPSSEHQTEKENVKTELLGACCLDPSSNIETVSPRLSGYITEIPRDSWISLPVRIYTNSMRTLPWSLIRFCVVVVLIAGILGIFLTRLSDSVIRRHFEDKEL